MSGLPFVNVKRLVIMHLKPILAPTVVRRDLPIPLDVSKLPLVRVFRAPGSETQTTANARVDLHSFAADEDAMWEIASKVHAGIHQLSGRVIDGHRFDNVRTVQDPSDLPWSATVFRAVAVYDIPVRPAS